MGDKANPDGGYQPRRRLIRHQQPFKKYFECNTNEKRFQRKVVFVALRSI